MNRPPLTAPAHRPAPSFVRDAIRPSSCDQACIAACLGQLRSCIGGCGDDDESCTNKCMETYDGCVEKCEGGSFRTIKRRAGKNGPADKYVLSGLYPTHQARQ
ncbi:hypothetical protein K4L06_18040 [Lysobacter sp. BMK333-48F3]|uniref:hypothetical protein n=1 Tax=Lysobacter sp. BMK333-48F3 TaxID=2867962 RepID=UPI001C8C8BA7|nr:hypothetical protein [Lysobacter sp. BMK333-48F3]MBX9403215.1 hypothetical protein [Lysobacter sp. BMK333-48F3]